ncbi:MAG TPA: two-component regulator propeller domain-containing protein [Pyrinomonadaceae bacterium]|jgi:signal transduction histidine kinase/ligand-binding sensor domain-containing protein
MIKIRANLAPPAFCFLILVLLAGTTYSQQYFKSWTTEDGLPQNNVINIAQTPDGYLWVATVDGLARFDGVRFKIFNKSNTPEMPNNRIFSMFTDTAGRLWFNYPDDQTIVVYENGKFKAFQKGRDFEKDEDTDQLIRRSNERLRDLSRHPEMRFRAGALEYVYENEHFVARPASDEREFPSRVFTADSQTVWIDDREAIYQVVGNKLTRYPKSAPLPIAPKQVSPLSSAERNGTLWLSLGSGIGLRYYRLLSFKDGKIKIFPNIPAAGDIKFDAKGNLWIQSWREGIVKVDAATIERNDPANFTFTHTSSVNGWALFHGRDDNLWSFGQDGLRLINSDPAVTVFSRKTGLPADNVYPIVQDAEGAIWFGVWNDKLINYRDGKFSWEDAGLLTSLFVDSRSRVWKGNWDEISYRENNKWLPVDFKITLPPPLNTQKQLSSELAFITEDKQGNMWFGFEFGLVRYASGGSQLFTVYDGLPSNFLTSYLFTRSGEFWVGTDSGVARMENGRFRAFTEKDGLAGNYTRSFYEDADGTIWIGGYDGGLTRCKNGEFKKITRRDGLFSDGVFVILEDEAGWFWMNSNQGIYRVRHEELNDFANGKVESVTSVSYGPEDGLLEVEGNGGKQPAGLKAKDGKLWFPMAKGVAVIDPKTVKRASAAPPVLIEEARIDQKPVESGTQGIRLNPDQVALEIDYTALGFIGAERMRFRYRLEGLEETWNEAGTRRTAYFSHLPYSEYTFRVIAANYDGVWNTEGAAVKITVVPPYYREWWFYALVILGAFGLITSIYLFRLRQLQALNESRAEYARRLIETQEAERQRIALELHDSIGQTLAVIHNRTLMGMDAKETEKMREQFREISEASTLALKETREIARSLHPAQIDNLGLTAALRSLVKSVESATGLKCEADIGEVRESLPHNAAINIYRISQECLSNIIKHSDASFAHVYLRMEDDNLVLTIEDDGRGFTETVNSPGLGLTGMHERAKMIGAHLAIDSAPGNGTKVRMMLNTQLTRRNDHY